MDLRAVPHQLPVSENAGEWAFPVHGGAYGEQVRVEMVFLAGL